MVRAPITDVELRLTVIPLNDIKLTLPTGLILLENTDVVKAPRQKYTVFPAPLPKTAPLQQQS